MAKFHIGKNGKPSKCSAEKGNCPYGSDAQHYDNIEQAKQESEKQLQQQNPIYESQRKTDTTSPDPITEQQLEQIQNAFIKNIVDAESLKENGEYEQSLEQLYSQAQQFSATQDDWRKITEEIQKQVNGLYYGENYEQVRNQIYKNIDTGIDYETIKFYDDIDKNLSETQKEVLQNVIDDIEQNTERNMFNMDWQKAQFLNDRRDKANAIKQLLDGDIQHHKDLGSGFKYIEVREKPGLASLDEDLKTYKMIYFSDGGIEKLDPDLMEFRTSDDYYSNMSTETEVNKGMLLDGIDAKTAGKILRSRPDGEYSKSIFTMCVEKEAFGYQDSGIAIKKALSNNPKHRIDYHTIRNIAVASNINSGNTYVHKNSEYNVKNSGGNAIQQTQFFESGTALTDARDVSRAEKYRNSDLHKDIKKQLMEGTSDYESDISDEENITEEMALEIESRHIENYTSAVEGKTYKGYVYASQGCSTIDGHVSDDDVSNLNNDIDKLSNAAQQRVLYRGLQAPNNMDRETYLAQFNEGDIVLTSKPTSTTVEHDTARRFSVKKRDSTYKVMHVYTSKSGAAISRLSEYDDEKEVLLPVGADMVVTDKMIDNKGNAIIFFADARD